MIKLTQTVAAGKASISMPTTELFVPEAALVGKQKFSAEYFDKFYGSFKNRNFSMAALGEGGTTDGGYLVPTIGPEGQIQALAPLEASMRKLALTISTSNDIKFAAHASKSGWNATVPSCLP